MEQKRENAKTSGNRGDFCPLTVRCRREEGEMRPKSLAKYIRCVGSYYPIWVVVLNCYEGSECMRMSMIL